MPSCSQICRKIQAKKIEEDEYGKAKQFRLFSIQRPHMRAFHSSWFCFFVAFTSWFGIQPLLPTIRKELDLTKVDLANSGIASVAATIAVRVFIGPMCDKFGPRKTMSALLICGAIPMALSGLIKNRTGLIVLRLCIGVLGGCFVPCQFWTSAMFSPKIVGTANAIVGGWGNLGGGFTFILMPGLFQLMKIFGADEFMAWKIAVAIPAGICIITGISIIFTSDDCPQGKWADRELPAKSLEVKAPDPIKGFQNKGFEPDSSADKDQSDAPKKDEENSMENATPVEDKKKGLHCSVNKCWSYITIVIFIIQYGMCFGVEIAVNTVLNLYFMYKFKIEGCEAGASSNATFYNMTTPTTTQTSTTDECSILTQDTASLIASLFGLMNLFARALGGIYSDVLRKYFKLAGRLLAHFTCLAMEGVMLIIFSRMTTIPEAIGVMVIFSTFVQMSEGTTYSIVPYISPRHVGIVAGLVGAGGNAGAMIWNTIWAQLVETDPSSWFLYLGFIVLAGSLLTLISVVEEERIWNVFSCERRLKQNDKEAEIQNSNVFTKL